MPRSRQSLDVTDRYRERILALSEQASNVTRQAWLGVQQDKINESAGAWLTRTTALIEAFQRAGIRLTVAYLAAYLTAETGQPQKPLEVDEDQFAGTVDGSPLPDAFDGVRIMALTLIKQGRDPGTALEQAGGKAERLAATAVTNAPRAALAAQMITHPEIIGWRRVTSGGCGACLASASGVIEGARKPMLVHDHCHCTAEPVVRGVPDLHQRPTGRDIFDAMTPAQQDVSLGPTAAALVRAGAVPFERLIDVSPMRHTADQLTQALVSALEA